MFLITNEPQTVKMRVKEYKKTYPPVMGAVDIKVELLNHESENDHHTLKNINNEVLPEFCQACLSSNKSCNLKNMTQKHLYDGKYENYSEMLDYCFSMQLERSNKDKNVHLICESCILRLRDVVNFKIQVEDAQQNIKQNIGIATFMPTSYIDLEKTLDVEFRTIDSEISSLYDVKNNESNDSFYDEDLAEKSPPSPDSIKKNKKLNIKSSKTISSDGLGPVKCVPTAKRVGYKDLPYTLDLDQLHCKICDETFDSHRCLQQHMPIHFPNYTCEVCGRVFASSYQFTNHNKKNHKTEVFECALCPGKRFKTRDYLSVHTRSKHGAGVKHNRCPQCGERFNDYCQRQRHLVKVHGVKQKIYKCKLCDSSFLSSSSRATHIRKAHLNERKHVCEMCEYSCFTKRGLDEHMLSHTGQRNFPCSVCKKRFLRKYTLNEHMKIHTGEKKHICHICSKAFTQRCSLKGHMGVHEREGFKGES